MRRGAIAKSLFAATVIILVCSDSIAVNVGDEVNQGQLTKTPLHIQNLHEITSPSLYLICRADAVVAQLNLDWAKISRIYQTVVNGGDLVASGGNQIETMTMLSQWRELKDGVASAFKKDYAATFFDASHGRWATCASFSTTGVVPPVTFCGLNSKIDLPVPCRAPKQGVDYIYTSDNAQTLYEAPNKFNVGPYACSNEEVEDAKATTHHTLWKGYISSIFSERIFDTVDVYTARSSDCSNNAKNSTCCHRACCNSGFSSSPFCQAHDLRRCY